MVTKLFGNFIVVSLAAPLKASVGISVLVTLEISKLTNALLVAIVFNVVQSAAVNVPLTSNEDAVFTLSPNKEAKVVPSDTS